MNQLKFTRFNTLDYACGEALNTLCTNLSFCGSEVKKIMITSTHESEGKTFLSMNILRTLAGLGKRVVLVDADLRRSVIKGQFGIQYLIGGSYGLTHLLAGMCGIESALYATDIKNAYMVPVGREVSNSLQLLNTPRLKSLLDALAEQFDIVLVDTSPVGLIVDAAEIAKCCDGALLVVSYNRVGRRELGDAAAAIRRTGCELLGAILNNVQFDSYSNRNYYYKSYYNAHYYKKAYTPYENKGILDRIKSARSK